MKTIIKSDKKLLKDTGEALLEDCCKCHYHPHPASPYTRYKVKDCLKCDNHKLMERIEKAVGQEIGIGGWK